METPVQIVFAYGLLPPLQPSVLFNHVNLQAYPKRKKKKDKVSVSKDYYWSGKLTSVPLPTSLSALSGKQWETHWDQ